jgi:hypothetical protein
LLTKEIRCGSFGIKHQPDANKQRRLPMSSFCNETGIVIAFDTSPTAIRGEGRKTNYIISAECVKQIPLRARRKRRCAKGDGGVNCFYADGPCILGGSITGESRWFLFSLSAIDAEKYLPKTWKDISRES